MCKRKKRTKILEFLVKKKQSTRCELATEFNVSTDTIDRDIVYLSGIAPVYTKQGNQGGIYILPEYRSYKNYLTDEEEECLYALIKNLLMMSEELFAALLPSLQKILLCINKILSYTKKARRQCCSIIKSKRIHSNMEEPYT